MTSPCIDFDMLVQYFGGSLSDREMANVMEHIRACPECMEKFASASNIMGNDKLKDWEPASEKEAQNALNLLNLPKNEPGRRIPRSPLERIGRVLNPVRTFFASSSPSPLPALVRSDTDTSPDFHSLTQNFANFQIRISLEQKREHLASIQIRLSHPRNTEHLGFILKRNGKTVRACVLRENHADFEDLPFGHYQLVLEQDGSEKGHLCFEIRESGCYGDDDLS